MLTIEEKQVIIINRLNIICAEIIDLFKLANSQISEEEAAILEIQIIDKMNIRTAFQQELESLTEISN